MGVVFTNALAAGNPRRTRRRQVFHVVIIACPVVFLTWPETIVLVVVAAIVILVRLSDCVFFVREKNGCDIRYLAGAL